MNNFSLVAFTQIHHFGSLIPNTFSINIFVFLINAYTVCNNAIVHYVANQTSV